MQEEVSWFMSFIVLRCEEALFVKVKLNICTSFVEHFLFTFELQPKIKSGTFLRFTEYVQFTDVFVVSVSFMCYCN